MVEQSKTVLKMTIINFGKRPRWNLYSAYIGKRRLAVAASPSVRGMQPKYIYIYIYNFRYQADPRYQRRKRHISWRVPVTRLTLIEKNCS